MPTFFCLFPVGFHFKGGRAVGMAGSVENLEYRIQEAATPIAKALQIDLVEVKCQGRGPATIVRVTIDKPGGVGIKDCEQLHHSLSHALDVVDPVPHGYRLEVSSPGLDRPLKHQQDFQRAIGKLVRLTLVQPLQGEWVVVGRLATVQDDRVTVTVQTQSGTQDHVLTMDLIAKAKLEVEF